MNYGSPRGAYGGGGSLGNYWSYGFRAQEEMEHDRIQARRESLKNEILLGRRPMSDLAELDAQVMREIAAPVIRRIEKGLASQEDFRRIQALIAEGQDAARQVEELRREILAELAEARETVEQLSQRRIAAVNQAAADLREIKLNGNRACGLTPQQWQERLEVLTKELVAYGAPHHYVQECEGYLEWWNRSR